ncbi:hypothetical protein ETD83_18380, partial [Actinomadura soli]
MKVHPPKRLNFMNRRWSAVTAAVASAVAAVVLSAVALVVLSAPSSAQLSLTVCTFPAWGEGGSYTAGTKVTYSGHGYEARVAHTAYTGAGWNPAATPT